MSIGAPGIDVAPAAASAPDMAPPRWTISVVSHRHGQAAAETLAALSRQLGDVPHRLILTLNLPEAPPQLRLDRCGAGAQFELRQNTTPVGFAANHNAALAGQRHGHVMVADPDLVLTQPLFAQLERWLEQSECGVVAPLALDAEGIPDDNGRDTPTPTRLLWRNILRLRRGRAQYGPRQGTVGVSWVAGLFMAMRADVFHDLGGFDAGYYMYCEDVDLCLRARARGLKVWLDTDLTIVHPARRRTFRSLRHLLWHLRSLLRLWASPAYRTRAATE